MALHNLHPQHVHNEHMASNSSWRTPLTYSSQPLSPNTMPLYDMENLQQAVMQHPHLANMFPMMPVSQALADPLPERSASISTQTNVRKKKPKAESSQVIQIQLVDSNMKQLKSASKINIRGGTKESRSLVQSSLTTALEMALNSMTQTQHKSRSRSKGHKADRSMSKLSSFSKTSKLTKISSKKPKEAKKRPKSIAAKPKVRKDTMTQEVQPIYQAHHSIDDNQFKVLIYKEPSLKKALKSRWN